MMSLARPCAAALFTLSCAVARAEAPPRPAGLEQVNHIVIVYLENRSFDHLYGLFPGANGLAQAAGAPPQTDRDGRVYDALPPVMNTKLKPPAPDARFPRDLPNKPFRAEPYAGLNQTTGDAVHRFYQEQLQIDGGRMDRFIAWSDAGSLVMSYYDGSKMPLWDYARRFTLADNFFHAAFGGSFLNHFWLVCACTPRFPNAPDALVAKLDEKGALVKDGAVTPDFYAVNTLQPRLGPHAAGVADPNRRMPPVDDPHIGDRLDEKGVDWAWYSGGWNDALAGKPDPDFQYHHQVFAMFRDTALGTPGAQAHLKDELDLIEGIHKGELPAVVFFKPLGEENEHPGYTNVAAGERHTADLIRMIERSPLWRDSLIIVTYDENGGLWDHVAPPRIDRWGPGTRVPTLVISPFAKKGHVDHTLYDTTSILKLIETRFGLEPLTSRDAAAADMTNALDLQ